MKVFVTLAIFLTCQASFAEKIYVAPVQGTNVSKKTQETLRELIKIQVQALDEHQLVNQLEKAETYLQSKLVKFNSYTLSMNRWRGNKKINSGQWKAKSKEQLEAVIAQAVPEITGAESSGGSAIEFPSQGQGEVAVADRGPRPAPIPSLRQVMVGFGPAYFNNMNSETAGLGFQAAYVWNVDHNFDLGVQSEFAISTDHSDAYALGAKLITQYFFTSGNAAPYLGAGFGYGWASVHNPNTLIISDGTAGGFSLSLQAGVKFFRRSDVNFSLGAEYTNIFDKSSLGQPGVFLIRAALYY